jgi:hypothetical protein
MQDTTFDPKVFSQIQTGTPIATYRKTILGKVFVTVYDPYTRVPVGMLLEGERGTDTEMIDMWSEAEDLFFKRNNKKALDTGMIIKVTRETKEAPRTIEQFNDDELRAVINVTYLQFQKSLSRITSEAVLFRLLELTTEQDKSEKFSNAIKAKLAEVQAKPANLSINR